MKRILNRSKNDPSSRVASSNLGKIHERERQCIAEYAQQSSDTFRHSPHMNPNEKLWVASKQQWCQRLARGFSQRQVTFQTDLHQIVKKSGKAIVANYGYGSVLS